jgi:hypothetical protein
MARWYFLKGTTSDEPQTEHVGRFAEAEIVAPAPQIRGVKAPRSWTNWAKGTLADWVMEGRRLAQTVAYRDLGSENPAPITDAYERHAEPAVELQLEKSGVRLAYLLDRALK